MAKVRTRYVCQNCGNEVLRWMGQCPSCSSWNSFVQEVMSNPIKARVSSLQVSPGGRTRPQPLTEVQMGPETRIKTGVTEFDRVMGGGIVLGSIILLAGDPGIGKSTLMTELGKYLPGRQILYVTGEESTRQVKQRAQRFGVDTDQMLLYAETNIEEIMAAVQEVRPDILIVDSIQTVFRPDIESAPGSVSQVRESAAALMQLTKRMNFSTFVVGHVTKQGAIAGPRVLEHMVDTVLYFEGERHHTYRILRCVKNRFGSTNEIGVFEMHEKGLKEIANPSELFLSERSFGTSGSTVVCAMEGTRPILVEIQALVSSTSYGTPQRTTTGLDGRRLQMLLAVLEKREGLRLSSTDVFVNVAGGVRLEEPAVDLGVITAVASSLRDVPMDTGTVLIGEVGLGGEIRTVNQLGTRIREASKLGFSRVIAPEGNLQGLEKLPSIEILGMDRLKKVLDFVL